MSGVRGTGSATDIHPRQIPQPLFNGIYTKVDSARGGDQTFRQGRFTTSWQPREDVQTTVCHRNPVTSAFDLPAVSSSKYRVERVRWFS